MLNTEPMADTDAVINFIVRMSWISPDEPITTRGTIGCVMVFLQAAWLTKYKKPLFKDEIIQGNLYPTMPILDQHFPNPIIKENKEQLIKQILFEKDSDGKIISKSIKKLPPLEIVQIQEFDDESYKFIFHATSNLLENKAILNDTLMNQTIYKKPDMYIRPAYNNQSLYDYFMDNPQDWLWIKNKELIKENY